MVIITTIFRSASPSVRVEGAGGVAHRTRTMDGSPRSATQLRFHQISCQSVAKVRRHSDGRLGP